METTYRVRLKAVIEDVDFRKASSTNFYELGRLTRYKPIFEGLRKGQAVCFISKRMDQVAFVLSSKPVNAPFRNLYAERKAFMTLMMRVEGGRWNPLMLANYAADCGIELVGLSKYEDRYEAQLEEKRQHAKDLAAARAKKKKKKAKLRVA